MRAELGSKCRKSRASDCREISASAPAISTPVGPPPMTTNVSSALAPARIGLALGALERQQHAAADLERVLERLQAGRDRAPLVVAEVRVRRAGRHDQVVVRQPISPSARIELLAGAIDATDLREQHLDVRLPAQDPADRRRDVAGRQRRHRHLIEQRLEDVMVAAVEDRHADARAPQRAGGIEAAEAAADDDDMGKSHGEAVSKPDDYRRTRARAGFDGKTGEGTEATDSHEDTKRTTTQRSTTGFARSS